MKGAPIRFVVAAVGGWTCIRIAVLLPDAEPLAFAGDTLRPNAEAAERPVLHALMPQPGEPAAPADRWAAPLPTTSPVAMASIHHALPEPAPIRAHALSRQDPGQEAAPPVLVPATLGREPDAQTHRWSASTWLLARGGAGGTLSGGQLGASQAGARLLYRISGAHRLSLAGRVAAPLKGRGAEAAVGLDWQPSAAPVHLVVEQRIGLDGGRGGPTGMVIGGLNPTPIAAGFRLEAYAQAGAILRGGRIEAFGDGALRLARPVAAIGRATIDVGVGSWAAGQRGAARADVGPTIGVAVPVAGRSVRLTLDWRHRIAGRARPGSGPALSIGSDF